MLESKNFKANFVKGILNWGTANMRDFPWRNTKNSYEILIAELLLQRTKANQVFPVYQSFIRKYPSVSELASASEEEIFELIKSLGLAKRAKGIKRMAQQIVDDYEGNIPTDKNTLNKIHWIGNYIANAVLCHAYGISVPTYDVNFARVIERFFLIGLKKPISKDPKGYEVASSLMPYAGNKFREFNLSIIDFSDAVCKPRKPLHEICPLKTTCKYLKTL